MNVLYFFKSKIMLKDLFWYILLFFLIYILILFNSPTLANRIWWTIWLKWFNEFMLQFSSIYNDTIKKMPNKEEIQETYDKAYSWATKITNEFKTWVEATKSKVDDIRLSLSWAENKINNIKNWINSIKTVLERSSDTIDKTNEIINSLTWTIDTSTWNIDIQTSTWETLTWALIN